MAMQTQQNSNYAARLGARIAAAHDQHADKPIDTGNRRLPGGIKNGIAKLSAMYTKQQEKDDGMVPAGADFFRASAVVLSPEAHEGEKVAGLVTQVLIPLCDTPEKGRRKAKSFDEYWFEYQNLFKKLGIAPPPKRGPNEDPQAAGERIQNYYNAAMHNLTAPDRPPVYILFSTRSWQPPAGPDGKMPEVMVFEEWHGLATPEQVATIKSDVGAGVRERQPAPGTPPPTTQVQAPVQQPAQPTQVAPPATQTKSAMGAAPPPTNGAQPQHQPDDGRPENLAEYVAELVEVAMMDPDLSGPDAQAAAKRLEELAWANGWGKPQTKGAPDWMAVGQMALSSPDGLPPTTSEPVNRAPSANGAPKLGDKFMFCRRKPNGDKLTNQQGQPFPPQEVEVVTVNEAARTCTVKTTKDGKDVLNFTTKLPADIKWDWRE